MPNTSCSQCNAWYNSEHELNDHLETVHRMFGLKQSSSEPGNAESEETVPVVDKPDNL